MSECKWMDKSVFQNRTDTYFNSKFKLDFYNVAELANYLINPGFITGLFGDPKNWLSSLIYFPIDATYEPSAYPVMKLQIGSFETNIECRDINAGFGWFNLGELHIQRHFNDFADYNGYTKIEVWLPYYGFIEVNPNDVLDKYLEFALSVDYNTGQAVYYVGVSDVSIQPVEGNPLFASDIFADTRILSTHTFQLGYQIPLGSSNASEGYRNIIGGAVKAIAAVTGAYVAGAVGAGIASTVVTKSHRSSGEFTRSSPKTGRKLSPGTWKKEAEDSDVYQTDSSSYLKGKAVMDTFESASQTLSSLNFSANRSDVVNNPAILSHGSDSIIVVIKRPRFIPTNETYNHLFGKPSGITIALSQLQGYTEIGEIHIEGEAFSSATSEELARLNETLVSGIIL